MIFKKRSRASVMLWVAMVIVYGACDSQHRNHIGLGQDGGYENLLIAIQKDVPENETIIHQLEVYY